MDCEFDREGTTTLCLLCHAKVTPIFIRPILALKHFQNRTIEIKLEHGSFLELSLYYFKIQIEKRKYQPNENRCKLDTLTQ